MAGIQTEFTVKGLKQVQQMVRRLGGGMRNRADLHLRYAIIASQWIDRNFKSEGAMAGGWKKLRPNTLAGRRKGTGRILQDRGSAGLKGSFVPRWSSKEASVGSPMKIALYHERGTRPYTITAKPGKVLAFTVATSTGVKTKQLKGGRTISLPFAKGGVVFARQVKHPGLPARRMLPRARNILPQMIKASINYVKAREKGTAV